MKKLIFILLISFNLSAQPIPQDKMLHFSGCYIVSATTTSIASHYLSEKQSFWIGVSVATALGIGKELYDIKHGTPSWGDLGADVIGAFAGSITITYRF